jgi:hypothetical protein
MSANRLFHQMKTERANATLIKSYLKRNKGGRYFYITRLTIIELID